MIITQKTFLRYENKYLLNETQYREIVEVLPKYMDPDEFYGSRYRIYNIYYDTKNNDIIRKSISKPYYKEKLRLRSYSIPKSIRDEVFLELKKKIGGVVSKRRAVVPLCNALDFIVKERKPKLEGYVNRLVIEEISHFLKNNKVEPKVFIAYDRRAFIGKYDRDLRITFDQNIITRRTDVALVRGNMGKRLLEDNKYLMEVKIIGSIPLWLVDIFSKHKIYSVSFSKYGTEYKNYCEKKYKILKADFTTINDLNPSTKILINQ